MDNQKEGYHAGNKIFLSKKSPMIKRVPKSYAENNEVLKEKLFQLAYSASKNYTPQSKQNRSKSLNKSHQGQQAILPILFQDDKDPFNILSQTLVFELENDKASQMKKLYMKQLQLYLQDREYVQQKFRAANFQPVYNNTAELSAKRYQQLESQKQTYQLNINDPGQQDDQTISETIDSQRPTFINKKAVRFQIHDDSIADSPDNKDRNLLRNSILKKDLENEGLGGSGKAGVGDANIGMSLANDQVSFKGKQLFGQNTTVFQQKKEEAEFRSTKFSEGPARTQDLFELGRAAFSQTTQTLIKAIYEAIKRMDEDHLNSKRVPLYSRSNSNENNGKPKEKKSVGFIHQTSLVEGLDDQELKRHIVENLQILQKYQMENYEQKFGEKKKKETTDKSKLMNKLSDEYQKKVGIDGHQFEKLDLIYQLKNKQVSQHLDNIKQFEEFNQTQSPDLSPQAQKNEKRMSMLQTSLTSILTSTDEHNQINNSVNFGSSKAQQEVALSQTVQKDTKRSFSSNQASTQKEIERIKEKIKMDEKVQINNLMYKIYKSENEAKESLFDINHKFEQNKHQQDQILNFCLIILILKGSDQHKQQLIPCIGQIQINYCVDKQINGNQSIFCQFVYFLCVCVCVQLNQYIF